MRVTEEQVRAACQLAAAVYDGQLKRADAIRALSGEHGINEASAGDFINDYRYLVDGKVFHRAMSAAAMRYFLDQIQAARGTKALENAIHALRAHIKYYEGYSGSRMHEMRRVADDYSASIGIAPWSADDEQLAGPAYLLTWNPAYFKLGGNGDVKPGTEDSWTCHSKKPKPGDRVYLVRLGVEPRGIVAKGRVTRGAYEDSNWKDPSKTATYIRFIADEYRLDAANGLLPMMLLNAAIPQYRWTPQSSGVGIPETICRSLDELWDAGAGQHSLSQYMQWYLGHLPPRYMEWLSAYRQTVSQVRALRSDPSLITTEVLARLWSAPDNGISNVGRGALAQSEFASNQALLTELTQLIVADPGPATLEAVDRRWREAVEAGKFSNVKHAVIRRVFAAASPERYTSALRERDCERILRILGTQFQLDAGEAKLADWPTLNAQIMAAVKEAIPSEVDAAGVNVALWSLADNSVDESPSLPREIDGLKGPGKTNSIEPPRNLVLYGPPGTGKTYSTVDAAIAILAPEL